MADSSTFLSDAIASCHAAFVRLAVAGGSPVTPTDLLAAFRLLNDGTAAAKDMLEAMCEAPGAQVTVSVPERSPLVDVPLIWAGLVRDADLARVSRICVCVCVCLCVCVFTCDDGGRKHAVDWFLVVAMDMMS